MVITSINNSRIWTILAKVGKLLAEGELLQLNKADGETVSETHYFKVIGNKTAALFSACTEVGAISAGADEQSIRLIRKFGENLGIGFQIKDDIFDYSDSNIIGKPTGNDLKEGKITWFRHSSTYDLFKELANNNYKVIVTTDHGTIKATNPVKIVGDRNTSTNLRYKAGKNLSYNPKEVFEMVQPSKYGLPSPNVSTAYVYCTQNDFFAYPNNYNHYAGYYKNTFQHGCR